MNSNAYQPGSRPTNLQGIQSRNVPSATGARSWWIALALFAAPIAAFAQSAEIQVYDAALTERGKFNLMIHNNFTAKGLNEPAFPGAVQSDHSLVGVAEGAYGVTDWFEQGL